jgi:hypothetical protein
MMCEQAELNLRTKAARGVNRDSVEELCQLLRGRGWTAAREIMRLRPEWNERFIRLLVRGAERRIMSYPGSPGYRLTAECTLEDIDEIARAGQVRIHQGRDMARTGIAFLRLAAAMRHTTPPLPRG